MCKNICVLVKKVEEAVLEHLLALVKVVKYFLICCTYNAFAVVLRVLPVKQNVAGLYNTPGESSC